MSRSLHPDEIRRFFARDAVICARELIGMSFQWYGTEGRIVETEAYRAVGDPACHTFFRASAREFVAQKTPGTAYLYLNYGMYWLLNFLTGDTSGPGFVLIRALEPVAGLPVMRERRGGRPDRALCSGPGKLTLALGLDGRHHATDFWDDPQVALTKPAGAAPQVRADRRIGISRAVDYPWRFTAAGADPWLSKPYRPDEGRKADKI